MINEEAAKAWLAKVWKTMSHEAITRVVVQLWAIWHASRMVTYENVFQSLLSTHCFVEKYLEELAMTKLVQRCSEGGQPTMSPRWLPPPPGLAKVNVDAALAKNSDHSATCAVARDEAKNFLGASMLVLDGLTTPEVVETIACREGMALAADLVLHKFRVACDCINTVKSIHGEGMGLYGSIVKEIKATKASFSHVEFVHERRCSNEDAHRSARSDVCMAPSRHVWFLSPPDGVCNSVMS